MKKLNDFGNKIGGARKDEWKTDGLSLEDLKNMNPDEKIRYVNRDNVWPLPNAKDLVENQGVEPFVAYWQRKVRLCLYKEPIIRNGESIDDIDDIVEEYVRQAAVLRDITMNCSTTEDVEKAEGTFATWQPISAYASFGPHSPINKKCVSVDLLFIRRKKSAFRRYVNNTNFPYVIRKTSDKTNKKKHFIPPQLEHITREGKNYRYGLHVTPEKWQKEFAFYGIEFGNWTSQKDRQISLDYCYDALKDLAFVLDIEDSDIAFGGQLSLAFGARGCSHACAHYELSRKVINLTKMHGAGNTAHAWFHALDHYIGRVCKVPDGKLASLTHYRDMIPKSFRVLIESLRNDADGNFTDYYLGAKEFDKYFSKDSFGCWCNSAEMAARAFACYVKDNLGCKSDYLIAHADVYEFEYEDKCLCAIPQGEEREIFNELFDQLFFELKELGYLHQRVLKEEPKITYVAENRKCDYSQITSEDLEGQLTFSMMF